MRVDERVAAEAAFRDLLAQPGEPLLSAGWGTDLSTFLRRASPVHGDAFLIVTDRRVLVMPIEKALALTRDGVLPEVVAREPVPFSVRRDVITGSRHKRRGFGHVAEFSLGQRVVTLVADRSLVAAMLRVPTSTGRLSDRVVTPGLAPDALDAYCTACSTPLTSVTAYCPGCARDLAWGTAEGEAIRAELRRRHSTD